MTDLKDFISSVRIWYEENNLKDETIKSFFGYIKNYEAEAPEDFAQAFAGIQISLIEFQTASLHPSLGAWPYPYMPSIWVTIDLLHQGKNIGEFKVQYSVDCEILDDMLL